MVIALRNIIDTHTTLTLFSFLDLAKLDAGKILDSIGLNEALSTNLFSCLVTQKYLVSMLEQALIPVLSALANRVGMRNPFNEA